MSAHNLEHYVGWTLLALGGVATVLLGAGWLLNRGTDK